jgi:exodeoxyribonuclease V gamma subunit
MKNQKKAFFSNQMEVLLDNLKKELFLDKSFSVKRVVIVPSKHIKNWIAQKFVEDENFKTSSFIKFIEVSQIDSFFAEFFWNTDKKVLNFLELNLIIEDEIKKLIFEDHESELVSFLETDKGFSKKTERRLRLLSEEVASLFLLYGVFGIDLDFNANSWQMKLWNKIYDGKWTFSIKEIAKANKFSQNIQLHFFALSYLPKIYCFFLEKLSFVNLYFASPCMHFWEDACSKEEKKALKKYFFKKNISLQKINEIESYLEDTNPLLANLGKIQKEYLKNINFESFDVIEDYRSSYEEWLDKNEYNNVTLLSAIQQDLLHLRNPQVPYSIEKDINSIQVHEATDKKREIEILYDFILKELSFLKPEDITVLCPNIKEYEPYIHLVFAVNNSPVGYKISDFEVAAKSFFSQGIIDLFSLVSSRFEVTSVLNLFSNPCFLKKHQFSEEDFLIIKQWIEIANINWGLDSTHIEKFNVKSSLKSWESGLERLLKKFIFSFEKEGLFEDEINFSDISLFDKFLNIFSNIKKDIQKLENSTLNLDEWQTLLKEIITKNLALNEKEEIESSAGKILENFLDRLIQAFQKMPDKTFCFETIFCSLKKALQQATTTFNGSQTSVIHFREFNPLFPSKITCLIGMNENYPEFQPVNSLNLLKEKNSYLPTRYDEERYLFLQSLVFSEKILYLSYIGVSPLDGKKQGPSSLILELLSYIKDSYKMKDADSIFRNHPQLGFDKRYFSSEFYTFSKLNEKAAKKYYLLKDDPHIFLSDLYKNREIKNEKSLQQEVISLDSLRSLANNPIKFYFNQVLGLYLDKEKDDREMKDLVLSNLDKFNIYRQFLKNNYFDSQQLDSFLSQIEEQGGLPIGAMNRVAKDQIILKAKEYFENFKKFKLQNVKLLDVEFKQTTLEINESEEKLNMPPFEINVDGKKVKILGNLSGVSNRGLITNNDEKFFNLIKIWPDYLIFLKFQKELGFEKNILFLKTGIEKKLHEFDVDSALEKYLKYYNRCLTEVSPLIKDWAEALLLENKNMKKVIKKSIEKEDFIDPYFKWAVASNDSPDADIIVSNWSDFLKDTFKPLLEFL